MVNVVAIDGPAGVGKSTVARDAATKLEFTYIDTGAMYRALTLKVIQSGIDIDDEAQVSEVVTKAEIRIDGPRIFLDGEDVSTAIRSGKVTMNVPRVSMHPSVRATLLSKQRAFSGEAKGVVMEGRDIGTVVFPNAKWKFFLDADPEVRARRRHAEFEQAGKKKKFEWVMSDLVKRDKEDRERPVSPLIQASDAVLLDTSTLDIDEVVSTIVKAVQD
ncbi:MAG: (d)CMP kinase [Candidatus Lindowbacteria bacterium]|nr:(d)CMP kinase [Candidatus Lindowbacteria bacterium]